MRHRKTIDQITSDELDQLYNQLDRVRTYAQTAIDAGDTGPGPVIGRLLLQLLDQTGPAGTEATDGATPAHDAGPTVAECAATDRLWWDSQKAGEQ